MITTEALIEQQQQPSTQSSASIQKRTLITSLKSPDAEEPSPSKEISSLSIADDSISPSGPESSPPLASSPKIGKWSEGSSYPSGFGIRIDSRSHLEVFDQKHRYGKNLRLYYKEWVKQKIELQFFEWLNSPNLTELPECPRAVLDQDIVYYCKSDVDRENCLVRIGTNGKFYHRVTQDDQSGSWVRLTTHGEGNGWIFVLKDNRIYAHEKITDRQPRFHHSSFFAGADVDAAGMFVIEQGKLLKLFPHSGHYRPGEVHMYFLLHFLNTCGVILQDVDCDAQRLAHVARQLSEKGGKARKIDAPYMWSGDYMLHFLRSKKLFWDLKIASSIKYHPIYLKLNDCQPDVLLSSTLDSGLEKDPLPPSLPSLERRTSSSIISTPSAPYYPSGTFGGGGIGKPLLLIPAISTYPLTAALRDDLLSRVKSEQQSDPTTPSTDYEKGDPSDPKDAGVLSSQP